MNNIKQILNDPKLSKELDKAYELAAPYRARIEFRLSIILQAIDRHYFWDHIVLDINCKSLINAYTGYIHDDLLV